MSQGERVAEAALAAVGAPFRLHGRDVRAGLDCVGLVAFALGRTDAPTGYAMRGGEAARFAVMLDAAGLDRVKLPDTGDVMLAEAGPGQFHLAVLTGRGFVHADAGLRRVVEVPGEPDWPIVGIWRKGG